MTEKERKPTVRLYVFVDRIFAFKRVDCLLFSTKCVRAHNSIHMHISAWITQPLFAVRVLFTADSVYLLQFAINFCIAFCRWCCCCRCRCWCCCCYLSTFWYFFLDGSEVISRRRIFNRINSADWGQSNHIRFKYLNRRTTNQKPKAKCINWWVFALATLRIREIQFFVS